MEKLAVNPNTIKILRIQAGLQPPQAADLIGVSYQTINRWENGKTLPSEKHMQAMARAYNVDVIDLTEPITEEEKEYSENSLKAIKYKSFLSDEVAEKRLGFDIHKFQFPEPTKIKVEAEVGVSKEIKSLMYGGEPKPAEDPDEPFTGYSQQGDDNDDDDDGE